MLRDQEGERDIMRTRIEYHERMGKSTLNSLKLRGEKVDHLNQWFDRFKYSE